MAQGPQADDEPVPLGSRWRPQFTVRAAFVALSMVAAVCAAARALPTSAWWGLALWCLPLAVWLWATSFRAARGALLGAALAALLVAWQAPVAGTLYSAAIGGWIGGGLAAVRRGQGSWGWLMLILAAGALWSMFGPPVP